MGSEPFLSALLTTIQQLQSTSDAGSVDVAYLGNTLRKEGHDWTTHGFGRLSVALAELQQEKRVETFRNEKGVLRVRAISGFATQAVPQPKATPVLLAAEGPQGRRFRPLRSPVWFAFAAALPDGQRRLVNCRTGMVWSDPNTPPGPSIDWVSVVPVGEDEQRRWADEFLDRDDIGADKETLTKSLQGAVWFRQFPAELEKRGRFLVRAWSHLRSTRIIEHVNYGPTEPRECTHSWRMRWEREKKYRYWMLVRMNSDGWDDFGDRLEILWGPDYRCRYDLYLSQGKEIKDCFSEIPDDFELPIEDKRNEIAIFDVEKELQNIGINHVSHPFTN